ncbi:MAG: hypothetical protein AB1422_17025 [bacterium]
MKIVEGRKRKKRIVFPYFLLSTFYFLIFRKTLEPNYGHGYRTRFTNFSCFIRLYLWQNNYEICEYNLNLHAS